MDRNIFLTLTVRNVPIVALRKESVDRNYPFETLIILAKQVALRKESVDRNTFEEVPTNEEQSRSPQGERG